MRRSCIHLFGKRPERDAAGGGSAPRGSGKGAAFQMLSRRGGMCGQLSGKGVARASGSGSIIAW